MQIYAWKLCCFGATGGDRQGFNLAEKLFLPRVVCGLGKEHVESLRFWYICRISTHTRRQPRGAEGIERPLIRHREQVIAPIEIGKTER